MTENGRFGGWEFDGLYIGRITGISFADGKNSCISTWHYDSIGRISRAVSDGHSYEYIYDEYGNLKEKRSNGKRLVSYTHDAAGQITEIKDPAGVVTKYEYDIMGRKSRIYNDNGLEVCYGYDALNRISHIKYGNGVEIAYAYDADGNISSMETKAGENVLLCFAYEYDGNGNRTAKTGMQAGTVLGGITSGNNALDISYRYDIRGQLLEECRNGTSTQYTYDKAGNRIKKTDVRGEIRYFYNAKNQLLREETQDTEKQFTYDRQGGIIKEINPSGICRFGYDSRHRQTKVEAENGNVQENRYDSENLRFELLENGKRTRFVYHDGELLHEEGGKENRQTGYHLGAGIEAFSRGQETYYYQQDEQLSTAFITGKNGAVHNRYQYDAFGNELETAGDLPNRIRYTGQQYDDVTGQYYLRARYYNPVLGRFMQEDSYWGDGLNLYAYCDNNPVLYYDPSGCEDIFCVTAQIAEDGIHTKTDFYVTPAGDLIPANKTQFEDNLLIMNYVDGKYVGETSKGPVRVRIEGPHPLDENFNGDWDSDHFVKHIHIEHRKNGATGQWGKGWNNKTTIPLNWIDGDD